MVLKSIITITAHLYTDMVLEDVTELYDCVNEEQTIAYLFLLIYPIIVHILQKAEQRKVWSRYC